MVTYWCSWCGATEARAGADKVVHCFRCVGESLRIFQFWPRSLMAPLRPGKAPGTPRGARRRFTFRDTRSGIVRHRTDLVAPPARLRPIPLQVAPPPRA